MAEVNVTGKDREIIQHSGCEKNSFSCVPSRIGCELAFGKFKNRMAFIIKMALLFNFTENSNAVIYEDYFDYGFILLNFHSKPTTVGMVYCVVNHFTHAILPYIDYITWEILQQRSNLFPPHNILTQICQRDGKQLAM